MPNALSSLLLQTVERELPNLQALSEESSALPRGERKWCPREELGHLLDSASNNRLRFVRAALDGDFRGASYAADDWVRMHGYAEVPWATLLPLWVQNNVLLARVVERTPAERFAAPCRIEDNPAVSLGFLIEDYVLHMQHHLDLLLRREAITRYPSAGTSL